MKKIAIGSWAYLRGRLAHDPVPLPALAAHLQALGFDGVELAGFAPHLAPADFPTRASRKALKALLDAHGLAVPALAADFTAVPPAVVRPGDYLAAVETQLDLCHDLEIPVLRVDTVSPAGPIPGGMEPEVCLWRIAQLWHRTARVCASEGVRVVWEFEAACLFNKPSEVLRLLHAVDHPNFTVLFDVYHAYTCGMLGIRHAGEPQTLPAGVVQFAHMLTGRIGLVHLSDCERRVDGEGRVAGARAPFGAGALDLDAVIEAVLAAGYAGEWWSIDLGMAWPDALADTAAAKHAMDGLMARHG